MLSFSSPENLPCQVEFCSCGGCWDPNGALRDACKRSYLLDCQFKSMRETLVSVLTLGRRLELRAT